ncbi:restriction endonuclease [Halosimplex halobium]|uniref:restriction endonuclease n=1 Tax=Halosimplex halobium TaxID=3396618 RepID=UPI003F57009A
MAVLDDLSGFEFEDLMEDVFRNLGYERVRQAAKTADEGRDILMEEVVDGRRRAVVVECKHTESVGRPVVQKLHSAIATFEFDGPKRGMVVTTGRFTGPAEAYAADLRERDDPYPIELVDGTDLREIAEEVGLDLYNGRIEILCDETLRPFDPAGGVHRPVETALRDIENLDPAALPRPHAEVTFRPVVSVTADADAVFETSVGVIHRVDDRTTIVVHADRDHPEVASGTVARLVENNSHARVDLDDDLTAEFDAVTERRFGQTETEYKEWAVERLCERYATTVTYTGDNNVTYEKTCEPNQSDISVRAIDPVYLPQVRQTVDAGEYTYPLEYYAAGPSRVTVEDGIHRCVHCETAGDDETYTYCENCGSISCSSHVRAERLEGEPVCTGCAVTERFALKTKYFYDEANREAFREEYEAMPVHEKAQENVPLAVAAVATALLVLVVMLASTGVL